MSTAQALRSTDPKMLTAALAYAERGWHVFPLHGIRAGKCTCGDPACSSPGKHPRTSHGLKDATTDPERIRAWGQHWLDANLGGAMGETIGLIALDVDPRHGGEKSLAELVNGNLSPETLSSRTGGGGRHLLFKHPGKLVSTRAGLRPGLDVRGDGGYIVLPPSGHVSGKAYAWEDRSAPVAEMPAWLLELFERPRPRELKNTPRLTRCGALRYADRALRDECEAMARAAEGTRNDALNRAAFNLGQLIAGGHLERDRVEAELYTAAQICGLVADDGDQRTRATLRSGVEAGMKEPRLFLKPPPSRPAQMAVAQLTADQPNATELGNAQRFASQHQGRVRYCHAWREWIVWDGRRWTRDRTGEVVRRAKETVRQLYAEVTELENETERRELAKHAMQSEAQRRIAGMLELAKSETPIATLPEAFDSPDAHCLLNVSNGTVDLRTGALRPHDPADLLTRLAPVVFDPKASCPTWDAFLTRVLPDLELRAFLQRFVGYALTGDVSEEVFCLLYGTGANGKSTFLETLQAMLGDYAYAAAFETFLEATGKSDRRGAPRADLVALRGARFVTAVEAGEGRRLDEITVKHLTGGDTVTARGLYQADETSFVPEGKLFLAANHRPEIRGTDLAIWRRVLEVPFAVTITEAERDPTLKARLREPKELAGILGWALAGCREWHGTAKPPRLRPPEAVVAATRAYREEQDCLAPFLEDQCVLEPSGRASNRELRQAYEAWCKGTGERPMSQKAFARRLRERGCTDYRDTSRNRDRGWQGIRLFTMFDQPQEDSDSSDR